MSLPAEAGTVGAALCHFQRRRRLEISELAAWLRVTPGDLPRLAAAPAPDRDSPWFASEVWRLTRLASVDVVRLVVALTEPGAPTNTRKHCAGDARSRST